MDKSNGLNLSLSLQHIARRVFASVWEPLRNTFTAIPFNEGHFRLTKIRQATAFGRA
jgi:hypothetical protein